MSDDLHGYLNVLKAPGWTSHDVVARLRRLSGQRRIGHTGTLDPAAVGVLPVALGRATRTTSSDAWDRKLYWADVRFGTATDTDDATGLVIATGSVEGVTLEVCRSALRPFLGDIEQRPPAYSAVHVDGRRAYAEARRGHIAELPARRVHVDAITVIAWRAPVLSLLIQCRSGTYIRSIARDLGSAVSSAAHLGALVRIRVGAFDISTAVTLERVEEVANTSSWEQVIWPVDIAALGLDAAIASRQRAIDFRNGRAWGDGESGIPGRDHEHALRADGSEDGDTKLIRIYDQDGVFLGLAERVDGVWQPRLAIPGAEPVALLDLP